MGLMFFNPQPLSRAYIRVRNLKFSRPAKQIGQSNNGPNHWVSVAFPLSRAIGGFHVSLLVLIKEVCDEVAC